MRGSAYYVVARVVDRQVPLDWAQMQDPGPRVVPPSSLLDDWSRPCCVDDGCARRRPPDGLHGRPDGGGACFEKAAFWRPLGEKFVEIGGLPRQVSRRSPRGQPDRRLDYVRVAWPLRCPAAAAGCVPGWRTTRSAAVPARNGSARARAISAARRPMASTRMRSWRARRALSWAALTRLRRQMVASGGRAVRFLLGVPKPPKLHLHTALEEYTRRGGPTSSSTAKTSSASSATSPRCRASSHWGAWLL
jgi:hypothetical protein